MAVSCAAATSARAATRYHAAGLYYLQDPGAMAVGALVDPRPGERVLDLAAAPGGKATHLAARMRGAGLLVANDVSASRARELAGNLERLRGRPTPWCSPSRPERLADRFGAWFDRVLVDAPCSGESMFHKSEAARLDWSPAAVAGLRAAAGRAARTRRRGSCVPAGCSSTPPAPSPRRRTRRVVAGLLAARPDFEPAALPPVPGASPGAMGGDGPRLALRLWPHRVPGAGHFVAALRGRAGSRRPTPRRAGRRPARPRRDLFDGLRRRRARGGAPCPETASPRAGASCFRLPEGPPELAGLRVVRPGFWLGTLAKDRFEPAHSLALAHRPGAALRTVRPRGPTTPSCRAYLRGRDRSVRGGEPGWALVRVDGFGLGWGKRVGSTVKNHYPKGLRRRG